MGFGTMAQLKTYAEPSHLNRYRPLGKDALLARVYRAWGGELHARFDYEVFQRRGGDDRHATAKVLDGGTWDYPLVVLETPHGVRNEGEIHDEVRWVIVEEHQRHRYLAALHALGRTPAGPHAMYIISSPVIGGASPRHATSTERASEDGNS